MEGNVTRGLQDLRVRVYPKIMDSEVESRDDYSHLLYSRGFQLTRQYPDGVPAHWRAAKIGEYWASWDSRTSAAIGSDGTNAVAVIGEVFHLGLREDRLAQIVVDLLESRDREGFDLRAQQLAGRYVLLESSQDELWLQSDATGMRSVYYATDGSIAASHARLAATLIDDFRPSPFGEAGWFRETGARAIPGRRTEYESVSMLTPNTKVDVTRGAIKRIPSANQCVEQSSSKIAESVIPLAHAQFESLASRGEVLVSLTAGLDSRTTLAMSLPVAEKIKYFSYVTRRPGKPSPSEPDLVFARDLCRNEGLEFLEVNVDEILGRGPLMAVMRQNSTRIHVPSIAAAYMNQLPVDATHVRSNLYEIGRSLIRGSSRNRKIARLDAREVARRIAGDVKHPSFDDSVEASGEWLEITDFRTQTRYDELDLYYWELLMGKWLPAVMVESDIAHDTYTVINSRRILDLMLNAPLGERLEGAVAKEIIKQGWPSLMAYPVNAHKAK